jgi:hypothetical protein
MGMEKGTKVGYIIYSDEDYVLAIQALHASGYTELADELEQTRGQEIGPFAGALAAASVRQLAESGDRPDAETFGDAYRRMFKDF